MSSNRRDFLKSGAAVAMPAAVLAVPALASAPAPHPAVEAAAIEALVRDAVRRFNAGGAQACASLACSGAALGLPEDACLIRIDGEAEPSISLDPALGEAHWSRPALLVREAAFTGDSTAEQMARFQGHGRARRESTGRLSARLTRTADRWTIAALTFA